MLRVGSSYPLPNANKSTSVYYLVGTDEQRSGYFKALASAAVLRLIISSNFVAHCTGL
jgi:hypothetical protein